MATRRAVGKVTVVRRNDAMIARETFEEEKKLEAIACLLAAASEEQDHESSRIRAALANA